MATKAKARLVREAQARREPLPKLVTKSEVVEAIGADHSTLDGWIAAGDWPPPWLRAPSGRVSWWREEHVRAYLDTGRWPGEAWRGAGK
jgi:predicted DNA-binding transcriptional regulator AlpA